MNKNNSSIDGFIPRRAGSQLGERHEFHGSPSAPARKELRSEDDMQSEYTLGQPRPGRELGFTDVQRRPARDFSELSSQATIDQAGAQQANPGVTTGRTDLDDSLRNIEDIHDTPPKKLSRKDRRRLKKAARTRKQIIRRRIIIAVISLIVAALMGVGAFLAFKAFQASGNVLQGNFFDLIQNEPLKEDANGRSNFLIVGTSEDDPGHEASYLTDSIMILSIDQDAKNAYTFSIPRDLYVNYEMPCLSGYRGKINVYFSCVNDKETDEAEQERLTKTQEFIGNIIGMDIQYGVHVNYTVMRDVIKAIGGSIEVTIDSRDPRGVMDSNFDWKCGPTLAERLKKCPPEGHFIQLPNGKVTLDAERALYLAQARGDRAPTYGFEQSNFDRERNQQMILVAVREKALSAGTLTNIGAVTGLIDALGNNLRTNVQTKEVRTLMDLAKDIPTSSIKSIDFYSEENPIFTTGPVEGAGSSVYPRAGILNYTELRSFLAKQLSSNPIVREGAIITVLNGSDTAGLAQTLADNLETAGFTIDEVGNAPKGKYEKIEVYQINKDLTGTAAKLKDMYGVTLKTTTPPVSVTGDTDFVIIIGDASAVPSYRGGPGQN